LSNDAPHGKYDRQEKQKGLKGAERILREEKRILQKEKNQNEDELIGEEFLSLVLVLVLAELEPVLVPVLFPARSLTGRLR
jgi:hypothetical protein